MSFSFVELKEKSYTKKEIVLEQTCLSVGRNREVAPYER